MRESKITLSSMNLNRQARKQTQVDQQLEKYIKPRLRPDSVDTYFVRKAILNAIIEQSHNFRNIVLDIGAGNSPYKSIITSSNQTVIYWAVDIPNKTYSKPNIVWDGKSLPFANDIACAVILTEVLEHVPNPAMLISDIYRVLKSTGQVFITLPFIWPLHDTPHDYFRYTPWSLTNLLSTAGFEDINIRALGGWDASLAQMLGLWALRRSGPNRIRTTTKDKFIRQVHHILRTQTFRRILPIIVMPIIKWLIELDCAPTSFNGGEMITGLVGIARKT